MYSMESRPYAATRYERPHEGGTGGDQQNNEEHKAADHENTHLPAFSLAHSVGLKNDTEYACSHRDVGNEHGHEDKYCIE